MELVKKPRVVLVVGDSAARSEIIGALRSTSYRVTSAGTFEQASRVIADRAPDVLITELRLGAFNGLHLVIRGRAQNPDTVAIIYTASPDQVVAAEARRLGADLLVRPVAPSALLGIISHRLEASSNGEPRRGSIALDASV